MTNVIDEQRKRREFLYYVYRAAQHNNTQLHSSPLNRAYMLGLSQEMSRNWVMKGNQSLAPILHYHLAEGNISATTPHAEPPDNGLSEVDWNDPMNVYLHWVYITHKGIKAVEDDHDLWGHTFYNGGIVDWSRTNTVEQHASSAAATPQSIGINISNISSAGNVNINLSNAAGRDQISATPLSVSPTYQDLLQDGIKFLKSLSYDKAVDKLRKATELEDAETKVHYYLAIALLKGRSFNSSSLHPKIRNDIEKHLKHAYIGNPDWLPPFVLLAVMEIEYHSLHGTPNKNVVIDDVVKMVKQQGLSPEESQLLSSCSLKERTKRRLHLTF